CAFWRSRGERAFAVLHPWLGHLRPRLLLCQRPLRQSHRLDNRHPSIGLRRTFYLGWLGFLRVALHLLPDAVLAGALAPATWKYLEDLEHRRRGGARSRRADTTQRRPAAGAAGPVGRNSRRCQD